MMSPVRVNLAELDLEISTEKRETTTMSVASLVPFTQPPPSYRPRPPLFPVPPPVSCMVPPPPLLGKVKESSSAWAEAPPLTKSHSWPSASGDNTSSCIYQRRALVKTSISSRTKLDPTSRPFTPAFSLSSTASSMMLEEVADDEVAAEDVLRIGKKEAEDEDDDGPLPKDPAFLLPRRLDTSSDSGTEGSPPKSSSSSSVHPIHRAPILPLTNCWGVTRPPLLPTPAQFPPFGPSSFSQPPLSSAKLTLSPVLAPSTSLATFTFPDVVAAARDSSMEALTEPRRSRTDTEGSTTPSISELEARYRWPSSSPPETMSPPRWLPQFPLPPVSSLLDLCPEVPDEYLTASRIGGKVPVVELQRSHTDLLFFNFYAGHGDRLQLTAASLLFERGWRFNIPNQIWLARWPGITPTEKTPEWEEGLYQYFDHRVWRRIPAHFRLHYSELAEKTIVTAEDVNPTSRFRGFCHKM